jgi:hypothetical protein
MNDDIFEPKNDLERQLAGAQAGEVSPEAFLDTLMASEVFMPVRDDDQIKGFQRSTRAMPLSVTDDDGTPILVLFSGPERAKEFVKGFPGYEGGLLTDFTWVLSKMGGGYGIALNPGCTVGFDMPATLVAAMAERIAQLGD